MRHFNSEDTLPEEDCWAHTFHPVHQVQKFCKSSVPFEVRNPPGLSIKDKGRGMADGGAQGKKLRHDASVVGHTIILDIENKDVNTGAKPKPK